MEFDKDKYKDLSLRDLSNLIGHLRDLYNEKYNEKYIILSVINGSGNVSSNINKEYGFHCTWRGEKDCCGTTYIEVPRDKYTEELETEIKAKYDNR